MTQMSQDSVIYNQKIHKYYSQSGGETSALFYELKSWCI